MITSGFGTEVYEVKLAILEPQAGDTINLKRYFSTSEQLIDFDSAEGTGGGLLAYFQTMALQIYKRTEPYY